MSDNRRCGAMRNATVSLYEFVQDTVAGEGLKMVVKATEEM